ncbi:MAG: sulfurtransferase [Acidimicrobiaceae bacterium]|nr:sulfurtransferase [Acidimicrobiaceae bacterium]|tara:strand:- start:1074 stop:1529 length:456 start_codon:yes stop_codon:yes gene_type:complete
MAKRNISDLVNDAKMSIEELSIQQAKEEIAEGSSILVDVRDFRERLLEGGIPGAISAPRGMLEWWIDSSSPYYREEFSPDRRYILYCSLGWRSALASATMKELGYENVAHIEAGFTGWVDAGEAVEEVTSGGKWFNSNQDVADSIISHKRD